MLPRQVSYEYKRYKLNVNANLSKRTWDMRNAYKTLGGKYEWREESM
jgi:hypothetical protein